MDNQDIVDFHCHYRPPWWEPVGRNGRKPAWLDEIRDLDKLVALSRDAGITLRLLSAPVESVFGPELVGNPSPNEIARVNDFLAGAVAENVGALAGLATIDAFAGDAGVPEAERSILELGLSGLVVDSSRSDAFFGTPQTLPLLEAANDLKVPVFIHPVGSPNRDSCVAAAGTIGNSLGRGFMNGVSFLSVLESRVLERWENVRLVYTGIGSVGLYIAVLELGEKVVRERLGASEGQIFFDVMGLSPINIRFLYDIVGARQLVIGSDWPIMRDQLLGRKGILGGGRIESRRVRFGVERQREEAPGPSWSAFGRDRRLARPMPS